MKIFIDITLCTVIEKCAINFRKSEHNNLYGRVLLRFQKRCLLFYLRNQCIKKYIAYIDYESSKNFLRIGLFSLLRRRKRLRRFHVDDKRITVHSFLLGELFVNFRPANNICLLTTRSLQTANICAHSDRINGVATSKSINMGKSFDRSMVRASARQQSRALHDPT